jgi:hypothetical protein
VFIKLESYALRCMFCGRVGPKRDTAELAMKAAAVEKWDHINDICSLCLVKNPDKPKPRIRRFVDAPSDVRCRATITLSDESEAQCGRRSREGQDRCWQHLGVK